MLTSAVVLIPTTMSGSATSSNTCVPKPGMETLSMLSQPQLARSELIRSSVHFTPTYGVNSAAVNVTVIMASPVSVRGLARTKAPSLTRRRATPFQPVAAVLSAAM